MKKIKVYLRGFSNRDDVRNIEYEKGELPQIIVVGQKAFHLVSSGVDDDTFYGIYRFGHTLFLEEKA